MAKDRTLLGTGLRLGCAAIALMGALIVMDSGPAAAKDDLVIGAIQFPGTFHPSIDAMATKNYILDMARRPFTTYRPGLETDLHALHRVAEPGEGDRRRGHQAGRHEGDRRDLQNTARCRMGRRHADHDEGRAVHLGSRQAPAERDHQQPDVRQGYRRDHGGGRQDLRHPLGQVPVRLQFDQRFPAAARASGAPGVRSRSGAVPDAHALRYGQDQSGPLFRALQDHAGRNPAPM